MMPVSLLFDYWYKGLGIVVKHQNFPTPIWHCTGAGLLDEVWEYRSKPYACPLGLPHHQFNLRGSTDRGVASVRSSHLRFDFWRPTSFGRRFSIQVLLSQNALWWQQISEATRILSTEQCVLTLSITKLNISNHTCFQINDDRVCSVPTH